MPRGGSRVLLATQCVPAGMKLRIDDIGRFGCPVVGGNLIGAAEIPLVQQPAADNPLLGPPLSGIDQRVLLARHRRQQLGGLRILLLLAEVFDANEQLGRVLVP
ncbi:hypothetical protein FQZ97_1099760 [compost metagenome]